MARALVKDGIEGRVVKGMRELGEVYEFFFNFNRKKVYAKINLLPDGKVIVVYSSHLPNKGNEL